MSGPTACTAYLEGSPTHPSWPAMHSAASTSAMWLGVVMNLTDRQWCETKKMDWAVGTSFIIDLFWGERRGFIIFWSD